MFNNVSSNNIYLDKERNKKITGKLEPVFNLFKEEKQKTLKQPPWYNMELLQQNNPTIALESSPNHYSSISYFIPYSISNSIIPDNINPNHKSFRKDTYELMALKKSLKLPHGKSTYSCGAPKSSSAISIECDNKGNSRVNGLNHCSSPYQCNFCQLRILSKRQGYLETINRQHLLLTKGSIYLITLTVRHDKFDSFNDLLGSSTTNTGILGAYSYLISKDRGFKKLLEKYNIQMSCRVFETTWGKVNGFHAHIHSLFYMQKELSIEEENNFKSDLYKLWVKSVKKVGLKLPNITNGIDVQDGSNASKYILKWACSNELSSGQFKKAKNGNYTINQLEQLLLNNDETNISNNQVKKVLSEYYNGCFGKRFLTWSDKDKLRSKYLAIEKKLEESDSEICENSDIEAKREIVTGSTTYNNIYRKNKVHHLRTSCELDAFQGVLDFAKKNSISTHDIHLKYDLDITEEKKLQRLNYFKIEDIFFPDYRDDLERRDYFIFNYDNLMETAFDYYSDNSSLSNTNSFYPYVIDFCKQYENRVLLDSLV